MNAQHLGPLKLTLKLEEWPLKVPFRITGHTWESLTVVVVTLACGGKEGRGEAAGVFNKGDVPAGMVERIEAVRAQIEAGLSRESLRSLLPPGGARNAVARLLPASVVRSFERRLVLAGEPISLHAFVAVQITAVVFAGLVLLSGFKSVQTAVQALGVIAVALLLALLPTYWLHLRVAARKRAILKALPDAVDLIVTTVEAGLALDAALAEVGRETRGPLGEELRLTVRETTLGRSRRDALARLNDRTQVAELRTFVQAIVQAEQTGIPVGQVLRTQAAQIRLKRRQRAETEAQRAPVKMVVVLALLVLPAMLLLVIGPAVIRMGDQL